MFLSVKQSLVILLVAALLVYLSWTFSSVSQYMFVFLLLGVVLSVCGVVSLIFSSIAYFTTDSRGLSFQEMRTVLNTEGKLILYPELLSNRIDFFLIGFGVCPFVLLFVLGERLTEINFYFFCSTILLLILLVLRLIPGSCSLTIERDYFIVTNYFLPSLYRFEDIESFELFFMGAGRFPFYIVGFRSKRPDRLMRIFWDGRDGYLPAEVYSGISSEQLLQLLEYASSLNCEIKNKNTDDNSQRFS